MKKENSKVSEQSSTPHKVGNVIGAILCVILIPILILNITLIAKSYIDEDSVPSVGGYLPMIVLSDSMYPEIQSGDLIICHTVDAEEIEVGDIISFFDPDGSGTSVVTHRVVSISSEDGVLTFTTKGDNNNANDPSPVSADKIVGVYKTRIAYAGNVAMFMQTTAGLIVCVALPLVVLIVYDIIRRRKYEKASAEDTDALLRELEALKAEKARKSDSESDKNDSED